MNRRNALIQNLQQFPTLAALRRSAFFKECAEEIESVLSIPELLVCRASAPLLTSFLRVVQWNIEKGIRLDAIVESLKLNPILKWADLILVNEADCGMARSGNRHVGRCLAEALGMNMAFAPAHFELSKGTGSDLECDGENGDSLQGNALLSRHPIVEARIIRLPVCFEPYEFREKRYGRRNCLWARVRIGRRDLWVGSAHLEVRNTPHCRAAQMRHIMVHLPGGTEAHLLGGDLNTNGFRRGTRWRTLESVFRLVSRPPAAMKERMRHPEQGAEPLFEVARQAGFSWKDLNSDAATASTPVAGVEDAGMLPGPVARFVERRLKAYEGYFAFKLDWLLGRGIRGLCRGEITDSETHVVSVDPGCVQTNRVGPARMSDHSPIYADFCLQSPTPNPDLQR